MFDSVVAHLCDKYQLANALPKVVGFCGCSSFLPQLMGWVRINTVKRVITVVVKIK